MESKEPKGPGWPSRHVGLVFVIAVIASTGAFVLGYLVGNNDSDPPPPPLVPINLEAGRYVALGDSYSAGEGLVPYAPGTEDTEEGGDRCHRSVEYAYAVQLEFVNETAVDFRACSGADVINLYDEVQEHGGVPNRNGHQVEPEVEGDDVKLVTVTIGGNDVGFAKVLNFCYDQRECANAEYEDELTLDDWAKARLDQLKADLLTLYPRLRQSFQDARILVLGYPPLFAVKPPPIINPEAVLCQALFNKFALDERLKIREWGATLNAVIQAAIDVTNETMEADQRLEFVEVSSRFAGHEPCGSDGEWVRFVGLINSAVRDGSFHPREVGQAMMARIIACHLDVFPDANTPSTQVTAYAMTGCLAHATAEVAESGSPSPVPTTQGST